MFERIRLAVLMLLAILCITAYVVQFTGRLRDDGDAGRGLAAEDELDLIEE